MEKYTKLELTLKNYLRGANYHLASLAFAYAKTFHVGTRKDGVTPEFQHQIEIALFATTLKDLANEELLIAVILLHDIMEDYGVSKEKMIEKFGLEVTEAVWCVTKKFKGVSRDADDLYRDMAENYLSSLTKGLDRIHNQQSMTEVFTEQKQIAYIRETEDHILPMLKKAAANFPSQYLAYMNIRVMIKSQIALIKAALEGRQARK